MAQYVTPRFGKVFTLLLVVLFWQSSTGYGQGDPYKSKRNYVGELFNVNIYDPHSKSYFRLERIQRGDYQNAHKYAGSQTFKGVKGRLAVVRSKQTQTLITGTIRPPDETWIGLRMTCRPRKLVWVTGEELIRRKHYTNWGRRWHYGDRYIPCRGNDINGLFAGIALVRVNGVIRWWAIAPAHVTTALLIEFPTGQH